MKTATIDRGTKYACAFCATLFYDLNKQPATCPKCKEKVVPKVKPAPRSRSRAK